MVLNSFLRPSVEFQLYSPYSFIGGSNGSSVQFTAEEGTAVGRVWLAVCVAPDKIRTVEKNELKFLCERTAKQYAALIRYYSDGPHANESSFGDRQFYEALRARAKLFNLHLPVGK